MRTTAQQKIFLGAQIGELDREIKQAHPPEEIKALNAIKKMLEAIKGKGYDGSFYQHISRELKQIQLDFPNGFKKQGSKQPAIIDIVENLKKGAVVLPGFGKISNYLDEKYELDFYETPMIRDQEGLRDKIHRELLQLATIY